MEQHDRELDSWDKLVEKAIDAEAKANLPLPSGMKKIKQHCPRSNRPVYTTVAKSSNQASSAKESQDKPSAFLASSTSKDKAKSLNSQPSNFRIESKLWKDKNWGFYYGPRRNSQKSPSTPATGVNTTNKKDKDKGKNSRDLS